MLKNLNQKKKTTLHLTLGTWQWVSIEAIKRGTSTSSLVEQLIVQEKERVEKSGKKVE